ncbi:protein mono-ADP-ribosyltransferase PARP14-like [Discoglossus pictus]
MFMRDKVLQKQTHEIQIPGKEKLKLDVWLPEAGCQDGNKNTSEENTPTEPKEKQSTPDSDFAPTEGPPIKADSEIKDPLASRVVIENVQDSCTAEIINLLLENVSNLTERQDFNVEMIPEICSAVVTFICPIDIQKFINSFTKNLRANQLKLTSKPLGETKSIRVENLPPNTSEDHLIIYFENPKIGGGDVQEALLVSSESAAVITFCDLEAVKTVLEKQHFFGKTPISVYPYHPSLGVALYGKNGPCVTLPKPIERPVSSYLLEIILGDAQTKQIMERKMEEQYCDITWPAPDCKNPIIKLCISRTKSTHLRTMAKIVHTWENKVISDFSLIISRYKVTEYKVNTSVWEAIKGDACSSVYERVSIKTDFDKDKVFLVGLLNDVTKVEKIFGDLVETATKQIERKNQSETIAVPLTQAIYELMYKTGLDKTIQKDYPDLNIFYDMSENSVKLYGLREEVLKAKCVILNKKEDLQSKPIHLDSYIRNFLAFVNITELSCLILVQNNINAVFQINGDKVIVTGFSMKDLSQAEEQIKNELVCKHIIVEDKKIIQTTEWKSLTAHLCEVYNSKTVTVMIEEFPPGAEKQVVIAGLSTAVPDIYQQLHEFLEKYTPLKMDIETKSMVAVKFIMEERKAVFDYINKKVKVVVNQNSLSFSGPRLYVQEAAAHIEKVLSSLYSEILHIDKPGAKKFCLSNEYMYITTARQKFNCMIYLQKDGDNACINYKINSDEPLCQVTLQGGVIIAIYKDDLTHHSVDVVVNAANEDLKHVGGLALDLLKAAGSKLQTDCDNIVNKEGRLSVGESVITDAGNLPCKQVIHTVGPRWDFKSKQKCERLLKRAIRGSLELAAENGHNSIAIPAVSSGIFGCPVDLCAQSIVESIRQFVETQQKSSSIKRIHLVDTADQTITMLTETLKAEFEDQIIDLEMDRDNVQMMTTKAGVIIKVIQANIQDATTDVIVNSVGNDLQMYSGAVSKALSQKAGNNLQHILNKEAQNNSVTEGFVCTTEGCNLSCQKIIHVVLPQWDEGNGSAEKMLRQIVTICLRTTEKNKLNSITFPPIGTEGLGFPKNLVAAVMFDEVLSFGSKYNFQHLQEVNFILHPSDKENIKAFSCELEKRIEANASETKTQTADSEITSLQKRESGKSSPEESAAFFGMVTTPALGVHEMKIGAINYQVRTGDITKENSDVIVNSTSYTFNLRTGVSKAILDTAGQNVEQECAKLGPKSKNGRIITKNGKLLCKNIIHIYVQSKPENIKKCVTETLQDCEQLKATSVAFPAFGTGIGGASPAAVADAMLDGIVDFASSKSVQMVQTVKVIVFQQHLLNDFYTSMKKREGTNLPKQTSIFNYVANKFYTMFTQPTKETKQPRVFEIKENIEQATFHLCGESQEQVKDASSWLRDLILKEQHENLITDDWINDFEEQEHQKLLELQKSFQVSISLESPGYSIKVSGLTRDVLDVSNQIQGMIKKVRDKKSIEREAELCSNLVEWKYIDGVKSTPFDRMTNLQLEKANNENKLSVNIDIAGVPYSFIIEEKYAQDPKGKQVKIERLVKHGQSTDLPSDWDNMGNDQLKVVSLINGSHEYRKVQERFEKTCAMKIIKIEKIQNHTLWINYKIKKQSMDDKNGNINNEKRLFHGTNPLIIKNVNKNGFNRSYSGKNDAKIGKGTYFAIDARYSSYDTYSVPDPNGDKYMYLARVLTGKSCVGKEGMVAPTPKDPSDPTDLHDSATDHLADPSVYVIFNDIQAYPEYLITFTK